MKHQILIGLVSLVAMSLTCCDNGVSRSAPSSLNRLSGSKVRVVYSSPTPEISFEEIDGKMYSNEPKQQFIEGTLVGVDHSGILLELDKGKKWINLSNVATVTVIEKWRH